MGLLQPVPMVEAPHQKSLGNRRQQACVLPGDPVAIMPALAAWVAIPFGQMSLWRMSMLDCCSSSPSLAEVQAGRLLEVPLSLGALCVLPAQMVS